MARDSIVVWLDDHTDCDNPMWIVELAEIDKDIGGFSDEKYLDSFCDHEEALDYATKYSMGLKQPLPIYDNCHDCDYEKYFDPEYNEFELWYHNYGCADCELIKNKLTLSEAREMYDNLYNPRDTNNGRYQIYWEHD